MSLVVDFEESRHRRIERELPWYVNGTIDEPARERIEQHLAGCSRCRREETQLRQWQRELAASGDSPPARDGFNALKRRIQAAEAVDASLRPAPAPSPTVGWRQLPPWLRWAAVAQACALLLIAVPLWRGNDDAPYRTLGHAAPVLASPGAGSRALLMFRPSLTQAEVRGLLDANGARIVDGPNPAGAWLVSLPEHDSQRALAGLRAAPGVQLVEVVDATEPP